MNTKNLVSIALLAGAIFALPVVVTAAGDYGAPCTTTYGGGYGGSTCPQIKFTLDKMVQKPGTTEYVDNLSVSDKKFGPDSTILFRIKVRNEGTETIKTLNLIDTLPQYLTYSTSADASYDQAKRQVKFTISNLKSGEEKFVYVTTKSAATAALPSQDTVCVINQVQGVADNNSTAKDNSQVCIEKGAKPTTPPVYPMPKVTKTPSTGAEMALLPLLFSTGAAGMFIRRRQK